MGKNGEKWVVFGKGLKDYAFLNTGCVCCVIRMTQSKKDMKLEAGAPPNIPRPKEEGRKKEKFVSSVLGNIRMPP